MNFHKTFFFSQNNLKPYSSYFTLLVRWEKGGWQVLSNQGIFFRISSLQAVNLLNTMGAGIFNFEKLIFSFSFKTLSKFKHLFLKIHFWEDINNLFWDFYIINKLFNVILSFAILFNFVLFVCCMFYILFIKEPRDILNIFGFRYIGSV